MLEDLRRCLEENLEETVAWELRAAAQGGAGADPQDAASAAVSALAPAPAVPLKLCLDDLKKEIKRR